MSNFWNKYYIQFRKLYENSNTYLIDGKEVTEKEFIELCFKEKEMEKIRNEKNTKEDYI